MANLAVESRQSLQTEFETLLGSTNVYFQPPETTKLKYPCIVYKRRSGITRFANNFPYAYKTSYEVTLITRDPDSDLVEKLARNFKMINHNRNFVANNLNHDVFILYY